MNLDEVIGTLPQPLAAKVAQHWQQFAEAGPEQATEIAAWPPEELERLVRCWAGSDYVAEQSQRRPDLLPALRPLLNRALRPGELAEALRAELAGAESESVLEETLRRFRHRHMVRIIWRDLNRLAPLEETTGDLTALAEACIDAALDWLYARCCADWGTPRGGDDGAPQRMVVIGMGKLGARELNLSSDIDLIFAFPANGETEGGRRPLDNQTFFNRLGQKLIQVLDRNTRDGFVFRVDMRLRPYGQSGILCPSFAAMESYYQSQGREWERYAMIKARVVAGDADTGAGLMESLRPFVYRKYLDYSAFESLRDMKGMINREVRRRQLEGNIKLGPGGIREVEFIVQAFQLIRGGRDRRLQQRELLRVLPLLPETVGMPQQAVDELAAAYRFLRNSEHALQAVADQQTQELPVDADERLRVAWIMGFSSWDDYLAELDRHRANVRRHFDEVIAPAAAEEEGEGGQEWLPVWEGAVEREVALRQLSYAGHEDPEAAISLLEQLRESRRVAALQPIARERLDRFMPNLLATLPEQPMPSRTLGRCLQLVESVLRRSAYLVMLNENPGALGQLVRLCSASPWFAEQLARQPILLDELLDVRTLYAPPDRARLEDELRQQLLRIPEDDAEQQMNALRYFKSAHTLRVAAAEISGALSLMKVSDYLTYIAEVVLNGALDLAWRQLVERHGTPLRAPGEPCDPDFIIVGYGKLGGIELSYGSDLDLVFIHDAAPGLATDGPKPLDSSVFFTRLGQKIIHLLTATTTSGTLYEVDMRLRPSGNKGLLVSSLKAFRDYQLKEAWTWEHQALVRARVVAGSERLAAAFDAVRREVLCQPRDPEKLRDEVREMREKMRTHLGNRDGSLFHLKHDRGGIVDIEFMVQYLALAHAHEMPELIRWSDNIRILDAAEAEGLLTQEEAELLRETYKALRSVGHRQALQEASSLVDESELAEQRAAVAALWARIME